MIIREATDADRDRVLAMALRFLATTAYGHLLPADPTILALTFDVVRQHGALFVAEVDGAIVDADTALVGFIALVALPHVFSGEKYADEVAWWVEPETRGSTVGPRLLRRAEAWALAQGLSLIRMIAPAGTEVGAFYERCGYQAVETAWHKRLA